MIEGPAGIGKTRLLLEVRAQAERAGMQVLAGRGSELERDFAFGVLRQALERPLAELDDADRDAVTAGQAAHATPLFDPTRSAPSPESLFHGLYWLLANLAERRPIVLAIDDAHWAKGDPSDPNVPGPVHKGRDSAVRAAPVPPATASCQPLA